MTTMVTDLAALAAACDPSAINPGPSPLRPLSRLEYDNTVRDLTGLSVSPATGLAFSHWFPPESRAGIFANDAGDAQGRGGDVAFTEAYRKAAEEIAASVEMGGTLLPRCEPAGTSEALCASEFIESFGKHAFRRPLTSEEVTQLEAVFAKGRSGGSYEHGLAAVVAQMLQSPNFLYRVEVGVATPGATAVPLTGYELATRLSYFLSGSMPDAHLLAAADANALSTVEELTAQAQRLLASPAARDAVTEFHRQWLAWDGISLVQKDATAFPTWTPQLAGDLVTEAVAFGSDVFWNDGRLTTFFTAPYSFMNGALARHYPPCQRDVRQLPLEI